MHAEMHARKVYGDVWRDPGCQEFVRAQESCFAATVLPQNLLSGKFAVCNTEGGIRKCRECGASSAPSAFSSSADMCNQHISLMQLEIDDEHAHDPSLHPLYAQSASDVQP